MKPLELGDGVELRFFCWKPDRALNPQYDGIPDIERAGAIVAHRKPSGELCEGALHFDVPGVAELWPDRPRWTVESWEPLTLRPSVLCKCGFHGFVQEGRWVPC